MEGQTTLPQGHYANIYQKKFCSLTEKVFFSLPKETVPGLTSLNIKTNGSQKSHNYL